MTQDYSHLDDQAVVAHDSRIRENYLSGALNGRDRGLHLARLANSAFLTGRPVFPDALSRWVIPSPQDEQPVQTIADGIYSLLHSGFWRLAEDACHHACETESGREAIRRLLSSSFLGVDGYVHIDLPATTRDTALAFLSGQRPWTSLVEQVQFLQGAFSRFIASEAERAHGGWDTPVLTCGKSEALFCAGQYYDAIKSLRDLLLTATASIMLVDGFLDENVLDLLSVKQSGVEVRIVTKAVSPALRVAASAFQRQYGGLSIRTSDAFHDRFIIIDDKVCYHVGASLNHAGKRTFMYSRLEDAAVILKLQTTVRSEWHAALPAL